MDWKCYLTVNGISCLYQDRCIRQKNVFIECDVIVFYSIKGTLVTSTELERRAEVCREDFLLNSQRIHMLLLPFELISNLLFCFLLFAVVSLVPAVSLL